MSPILPEGIYEQVITKALEPDVSETKKSGLEVLTGALAASEADVLVARHVAAQLRHALAALPKEERETRRIELCNAIVSLLGQHDLALDLDGVSPSSELLLAVHRDPAPPPRTVTPLALSGLLTGANGEPRLGAELEAEIATADAIDLLVSFITWEGWRRLQDAFRRFAAAGRRLRVLTTTYTGATEAEAVEELARLPGAQVRISYDTRRTRLHAKAWLFHRSTGFSTAWIGSANLSKAALGGGLEWTVKVGQADLGHVLEKFQGTFDTLWEGTEFEAFDPASEADRARLREALNQEGHRGRPGADPMLFVTLKPFPFQQAILDQLEAERTLHQRYRNLVVAATGTGKTLLAAFDYARLASQSQVKPRLLFVAHREELLAQARLAYRHVLRDEAFGELLGGGSEAASYDHLFTTVQSFRSRRLAEKHPPDHWDAVVIDECHHSTADTYTDLVERLKPRYLLGLTATPERADGEDIRQYFDGRLAAEIRLWGALEQQLLAPFEYYGLADGVDLSVVRWERGSYVAGELERVYTGNDRRAELIIEQFRRLRGRVEQARAIGFCVGVAHADYMARKFTQAGIPALAVHGGSADDLRRGAPRQLEARKVNILFTCDLFNEGIDLPFVDTLLLLRPTSSPTVFLQQLGRGLRLHEGKQCCLVLDFIGQSHEKFRFDRNLTAMTGIPRGRLTKAVEAGFPTLPSGCHLKLDSVARKTVLENLKHVLGGGVVKLTRELEERARVRGGQVTLGQFLEDAGRSLEDVYAAGGWTRLRRTARLLPEVGPAGEAELGGKLKLLLHVDDPERLLLYAQLAAGTLAPASLSLADRRRLLMLGYQFFREPKRLFAPLAVPSLFDPFPALREELGQLVEVLFDQVHLGPTADVLPGCPLALHRTYSRREAQTAIGDWDERKKPESREGLRRVDDKTEMLFVTLVKEEKHFSPTTRYRDYAVSQTLFHWQSQSNTSPESPTGQRYLHQKDLGQTFLLFVRKEKGEEYSFLGPVHYVRHEGSRPVSILWRLEQPMPASLFEAYATLHAA